MRNLRIWSSALLLLVTLAACGSDDDSAEDAPATTAAPTTATVPGPASTEISVISSAFADGEPIPQQYTCDGANDIPPIAWTGVPAQATSVALVVNDPDAPRPGGFLHWLVVDLPVGDGAVPPVPDDARQLPNGAGNREWTGPCPPSGVHHYEFSVYALAEPPAAETPDAIKEAAIAEGTLVGTYTRG
jgi:Raf kinase inhibitor-like YbhB/YbcL family protein